MQEVSLPIVNNSACESMYRDAGYVEHIPHIFICAGYASGGKDSCEVRTNTYSRTLYNRLRNANYYGIHSAHKRCIKLTIMAILKVY
jgi:hypothetical protein